MVSTIPEATNTHNSKAVWRIASFCLFWDFQVLLSFEVPWMPYVIHQWTVLFPAPCLVHWRFYRLIPLALSCRLEWPIWGSRAHLEVLLLLLFNVLRLFQFYQIFSKLKILQLHEEFQMRWGFVQWHCIKSFFLSGLSFSPNNFSSCNSYWFAFRSLLSAELDFYKEGW